MPGRLAPAREQSLSARSPLPRFVNGEGGGPCFRFSPNRLRPHGQRVLSEAPPPRLLLGPLIFGLGSAVSFFAITSLEGGWP